MGEIRLGNSRAAGTSEAPAPCRSAGQDRPYGTPKEHCFGFWSSPMRLNFDSSVLVLLFAHSRNAKSRGLRRKMDCAKFPAANSHTEIPEIRCGGGGPDCPAWGHALKVSNRDPQPLDDRSAVLKVPPPSWGSGRGVL